MLRLAQWDWLRMKCTTLQYINTLTVCSEALREIIEILSPIRADSVEGANGLKAKHELEKLESQLDKLKQQTLHTTANTFNFRRTESRFNRRSFVL